MLYVPEPGLVVRGISTNLTPAEVSSALKLLTIELLGDSTRTWYLESVE